MSHQNLASRLGQEMSIQMVRSPLLQGQLAPLQEGYSLWCSLSVPSLSRMMQTVEWQRPVNAIAYYAFHIFCFSS